MLPGYVEDLPGFGGFGLLDRTPAPPDAMGCMRPIQLKQYAWHERERQAHRIWGQRCRESPVFVGPYFEGSIRGATGLECFIVIYGAMERKTSRQHYIQPNNWFLN